MRFFAGGFFGKEFLVHADLAAQGAVSESFDEVFFKKHVFAWVAKDVQNGSCYLRVAEVGANQASAHARSSFWVFRFLEGFHRFRNLAAFFPSRVGGKREEN